VAARDGRVGGHADLGDLPAGRAAHRCVRDRESPVPGRVAAGGRPGCADRREGQMVTTAVPAAERPWLRSLRGWVAERGILYALLETPILAVLGGFFYRLVPYPFASLSVLAAVLALPIWVAHRGAVSADPDEPVHHLHASAVYALLPGAVFTVARIPANILFGVIYWHPWYDFGSALTGAPAGRYGSLLAGAVLNALQGWSVRVGVFRPFQRPSLLNGVL